MIKKIKVGNINVGENSRVFVQTMLKNPSHDIKGNTEKAKKLEAMGCEILRIAIPDKKSVELIDAIKKEVRIPLVADIHFDHRLAIESIAAGIDKIRINPGNIGDDNKVLQVVKACKMKNIPIRIGINSGSLSKEILKKYDSLTAEALCKSALLEVDRLNRFDFDDIIVSIKSSDVLTTIKANEILSKKCNYPLHIGITETGIEEEGIVKAALGIGCLLTKGIGNTIRVSLTGEPEDEIKIGNKILEAIKIKSPLIEIISCPTCGRTKANMILLVKKLKNYYENYHGKAIKLAIMGCLVNGPGEIKKVDIGVICSENEGFVFKNGKFLKKVDFLDIFNEVINQVNKFQDNVVLH